MVSWRRGHCHPTRPLHHGDTLRSGSPEPLHPYSPQHCHLGCPPLLPPSHLEPTPGCSAWAASQTSRNRCQRATSCVLNWGRCASTALSRLLGCSWDIWRLQLRFTATNAQPLPVRGSVSHWWPAWLQQAALTVHIKAKRENPGLHYFPVLTICGYTDSREPILLQPLHGDSEWLDFWKEAALQRRRLAVQAWLPAQPASASPGDTRGRWWVLLPTRAAAALWDRWQTGDRLLEPRDAHCLPLSTWWEPQQKPACWQTLEIHPPAVSSLAKAAPSLTAATPSRQPGISSTNSALGAEPKVLLCP